METNITTETIKVEPAKKARSTGYERTMLFLSSVRTIACLGVFVAVVFVIFRLGPSVETTINEAAAATTTLNAVASEVQAANLPGLIEDMNQLIREGDVAMVAATQTMQSAFQAVEALNIRELNEAISDFGAVVEPLSRLFGKK